MCEACLGLVRGCFKWPWQTCCVLLLVYYILVQFFSSFNSSLPSSFQWCPVTGQGAMGTNWGTGSSIWTWGRTSSLWGWRSTGTGCPGRLWSLLLWRYSRPGPGWTRCCAACCRWPCFGRGLDWVTHRGPVQPLPFCDSVILWLRMPVECLYNVIIAWDARCRQPEATMTAPFVVVALSRVPDSFFNQEKW